MSSWISPEDPKHWSHFDDGSLDELVPLLANNFGRRWGGVWIAPREPSPTIGIGLVNPTADDILLAEARARAAGWTVSVCGVPYSEVDLEGFNSQVADLLGTDEGRGILGVGIGYNPLRVVVELNEVVEPTLQRVVEMVPSQVLAVEIRPGAQYVAG